MNATRTLGLGMLALTLASCTTHETPEQDQEPVVTTLAEEPSATPEPTPVVSATPEAGLSAEDDYLATVKGIASGDGISLGSADDTALLAAGQHACQVYDAGGSYALAASMTVTDLPDDVDPDGHYLAAFVAAGKLCTQYWEQVKAEQANATP